MDRRQTNMLPEDYTVTASTTAQRQHYVVLPDRMLAVKVLSVYLLH